MNKFKLRCGDNIELIKKLPDNSIDAIVSDPPYGLSFMSKRWDHDVPSVEFWREVYRVLKPGGHVLSFGGTRTYHRLVVNIEDAGFEIRDQIQWVYASGFPKSHNIGKAVDKLQGNEREVDETKTNLYKRDSDYVFSGDEKTRKDYKITKGQSEWEGWGTALKPANEPICLARKPLSEKSVALNVLKWGTGGINIDGCRIGFNENDSYAKMEGGVVEGKQSGVMYHNYDNETKPATGHKQKIMVKNDEGRFPANIILECICDEVIKGDKGERKERPKVNDHNENSIFGIGGVGVENYDYNDKGDIHTDPNCPCYIMDQQSGFSKTNCKKGEVDMSKRTTQGAVFVDSEGKPTSGHKKIINASTINDKGGASRFFYQAKVSKKERNMGLDGFEEKQVFGDNGGTYQGLSDSKKPSKNSHPTVKPVQLMSYLCRMITPPGGTILDPYMGSGSTGIAALLEGFNFIGFDLDPEYVKIAEARISNYEKYREFLKK